jgi:hypothetical protein
MDSHVVPSSLLKQNPTPLEKIKKLQNPAPLETIQKLEADQGASQAREIQVLKAVLTVKR